MKIYGHCINSGDQATINRMKKVQGSDKNFRVPTEELWSPNLANEH
jgi:hypothetical protein